MAIAQSMLTGSCEAAKSRAVSGSQVDLILANMIVSEIWAGTGSKQWL